MARTHLYVIDTTPRFALGACQVTPQAQAALKRAGILPQSILRCHQAGDWGDVTERDRQANERALANGGSLVSRYRLPDGTLLWCLTDAARRTTTLLGDEMMVSLSGRAA